MKAKASTKPTRRSPKRVRRQSWVPGVDDSALAQLLLAHAKTRPATMPSGRNTKPVADFIFMRPPCHDHDCPLPDPDDDPPDPCGRLQWRWQPDLVVELRQPDGKCPSSAQLQRIKQALAENLSAFQLPDPDIHVTCQDGRIRAQVWATRVQPGSCAALARARADIPILTAGYFFGLYINSALIRRIAAAAFAAAPKRLSSQGKPQQDGPIHLTGLSVGFEPPHTVQTYVQGYDERPWPDVTFTKTIIETLEAAQGYSSEEALVTSSATPIAGLFLLGLLTAALPLLLPVTAFVLFNDLDAALDQPQGADDQGGIGAQLLRSLPTVIPLPKSGGVLPPIAFAPNHPLPVEPIEEKKQIRLDYNQPNVSNLGLFMTAAVQIVNRVPAVSIEGPQVLAVTAHGMASGSYRVRAEGFFGKVTIEWSAVGSNVEISNPTRATTRISFRKGAAAPGDTIQRKVRVRLTDVEGSSAGASLEIAIDLVDSTDLPAHFV